MGENVFHNISRNLIFCSVYERQSLAREARKVIHNRGPKRWKTFGRFDWSSGGIDVLLHHESRGDSRERARDAYSLYNPFISLIINELLFL